MVRVRIFISHFYLGNSFGRIEVHKQKKTIDISLLVHA